MNMTYDIENKLIREQIPKYSNDLSYKFIQDAQYRQDQIETYSPSLSDRIIQIPSLKGKYCFRIRFRHPVSIFIPKETHILSRSLTSFKSVDAISKTAFIASYLANLNHFTIFHVNNTKIQDYLNDQGNSITKDICVKLVNKSGTPAEFSSLNFLVQQHATRENMTNEEIQIIKKCFEFSYWNIPHQLVDDYSTIHRLIYYDFSGIRAIYSPYKTIFKITKLSRKRDMEFTPHQKLEYHDGKGKYLIGDELLSTRNIHRLHIAEPLASNLKIGDTVSCILIMPQKMKGHPNPSPMILGMIGKKITESDYRQIISIIFWKKNQTVSYASNIFESIDIDELKQETEKFIRSNSELFDDSQSYDFEEKFMNSLENLYPQFFCMQGRVFSIPSTILNYAITNNFPILKDHENFGNLIEFMNTKINFDERFFDNKKKMALRTSKLAEEIQKSKIFGSTWEEFIQNIPRIANRVVYSRVISSYYR